MKQRPDSPNHSGLKSTGSRARVFVVANQKGGVGKTTTAISLAAAAAYAGKRTLLIDLDSQANATSGLGLQGIAAVQGNHYLVRSADVGRFVLSSYIEGLDVLGSTPELIHVEGSLSKTPDGHRRLAQAIRDLPARYDLIFVDCPPSLGLLTQNALTAADGVLIPIQCEYFAMEGLGRVLEAVKKVRTSGNPQAKVQGIILTMYDPQKELSLEVEREVRGHFGETVYLTNICRDVAISESNSFGKVIFDYAPRSHGAHDYLFLTREVLNGIG